MAVGGAMMEIAAKDDYYQYNRGTGVWQNYKRNT